MKHFGNWDYFKKKVNVFKYLGNLITSDERSVIEVKCRLV